MLRNLRALRTPVIVVLVAIALSLVSDAVWFFGGEGERGKPDPVWYLLLPLMGWGLGCWLLARERSAQEVEFSNAWPVSRARAWAATVLSGLTVLAALLLLVSVVGAGLDWTWAGQVLDEARGDYAGAVWLLIAATLVLFALGLLMSTIAGSPFEAVGLSFVAGLVAGIGLWLVFLDFIPTRWGPQLGLWPEDLRYSATAIVAYAGMLTLAFGGASYLGYTRAPALEARRRTWLSLGAGVGLALVATVLFPLGVWLLGQPSPGDINEITWATTSPDGGWMCFSAAEPEGPLGRKRSRLWMMRPDGSGLRCIARGPQPGTASSAWEHPRWLPIM